jgi:DNA-directed RNA polymerase subunit RPC12/RpoP
MEDNRKDKKDTVTSSCHCPYCEDPICPDNEEGSSPCKVTLLFCSKCGEVLEKEADRCPKCGLDVK